MNNQTGIIQILAGFFVLLLVVGIGVGVYIANHNTYSLPSAHEVKVLPIPTPLSQVQVTPSASPIQNAAELQTTQKNLDSSNVDGLDADLSQLNSAASNF